MADEDEAAISGNPIADIGDGPGRRGTHAGARCCRDVDTLIVLPVTLRPEAANDSSLQWPDKARGPFGYGGRSKRGRCRHLCRSAAGHQIVDADLESGGTGLQRHRSRATRRKQQPLPDTQDERFGQGVCVDDPVPGDAIGARNRDARFACGDDVKSLPVCGDGTCHDWPHLPNGAIILQLAQVDFEPWRWRHYGDNRGRWCCRHGHAGRDTPPQHQCTTQRQSYPAPAHGPQPSSQQALR